MGSMKIKNMTKEAKHKLTHLVVLYDEVDVLKLRVKQHDTDSYGGVRNVKNAINVLQERIGEIKADLLNLE
jgi:hypothetical protein